MTLYPKSGMAFLSQLGGTLSDEAELEELCDVTLKQRFQTFKAQKNLSINLYIN